MPFLNETGVGISREKQKKEIGAKTYITAANACILDIDENIMGILELWNWSILVFDFMDAL